MLKIIHIFLFCWVNFGVINAAVSETRVINLGNRTPNSFEYLEKEKYYLSDDNEMKKLVHIQLYYECLCPDCILFDTTQFSNVVDKLYNYVKINTYPYGNAKTDDETGEITCQHGPRECYGNMLHACALDSIQNKTTALIFNSCLMEADNNHHSDDNSADECGKQLNVNSDSIKKCARSDQGKKLLKYYGEETKKMHLNYVPYVLINNVEFKPDTGNFMKSVCAVFKKPPPPCI